MYALFPNAAIPVGSASSSTIPKSFLVLPDLKYQLNQLLLNRLSVYIKVFPSSEAVTTSEDVFVVDLRPSGKLSLYIERRNSVKVFFICPILLCSNLTNPLVVDEATIASNAEKLTAANFFFIYCI